MLHGNNYYYYIMYYNIAVQSGFVSFSRTQVDLKANRHELKATESHFDIIRVLKILFGQENFPNPSLSIIVQVSRAQLS